MSAQAPGTPALVDERAARVVAAATVTIAATVLLTGWWLLFVPLGIDFLLRATGRQARSPLARLARDVVVPRLPGPPRPVAARPKQFAAGIGAVMCAATVIAFGLGAFGLGAFGLGAFGLGAFGLGATLASALVVAAFLEAAFAYCIGCRLYAALARTGVVAECPECEDISARLGVTN